MKGEQLYEKIEAYLNGDLSAADHKVFEDELANDAALQKEVELHRRLDNELSKPNKKLLRDNLKVISARQTIDLTKEAVPKNIETSKPATFKWLPILLIALALLGGAYFLTRSTVDKAEVKPLPPQQELESPTQTPQEQTPPLEQPAPTSNGRKLHQANNENIEKPELESEVPLIASVDPADFENNPYLDNQIGNTVRGESYNVVMDESATAEKIRLTDGVAQLRLKGALKSDGELAKEASFVLMIYTNKKEDYLEDRAILNVPINLQPLNNDAFPFQFNANLRITPGLYYYLIAEKDNDEPLHVGKFEVQLGTQ